MPIRLIAAIIPIIFFGNLFVTAEITLTDGPCRGMYVYRKNCDFPASSTVKDIGLADTKVEDCWRKCLKTSGCTHFSHNLVNCTLKSAPASALPVNFFVGGVCGKLTL